MYNFLCFSTSHQQENEATGDHTEKYVVFHHCLMTLLERCGQCGSRNCKVVLSYAGTLVTAHITCPRKHKETWRSQPLVQGKALFNVLLCSAILFSGSSSTKVLRLLSPVGVQTLQKSMSSTSRGSTCGQQFKRFVLAK